jgi:hypothetical protein
MAKNAQRREVTPQSYEQGCRIKVRFASAEEAQAAQRHTLQVYGRVQAIYSCCWCAGYHLTTRSIRRF